MEIEKLLRKNIKIFEPYRSARDEYARKDGVFLERFYRGFSASIDCQVDCQQCKRSEDHQVDVAARRDQAEPRVGRSPDVHLDSEGPDEGLLDDAAEQYPDLWTARKSDLCYATTNRQTAIQDPGCARCCLVGEHRLIADRTNRPRTFRPQPSIRRFHRPGYKCSTPHRLLQSSSTLGLR